MMTNALITNIKSVETYSENFINAIIDYSPRLLSALLILFVGIWAIRIIGKVVRKIMQRRDVEPTLIEFLSDILFWGMRIVLFIAVISKLGIESSSFVAILGAMGLAIGLSLQGSLSNFAGGMLIIMFKPFKLGDFIEAQNVSGTVVDIQIFVTKLQTFSNQLIYIPNGALSNGTITNYSQQDTRRFNITIGISYESDIKQVKDIIQNILEQHPGVIKKDEISIIVREFTDSGINLGVRGWTETGEYFKVLSEVLEQSKAAFDQANIAIQPYVKEFSKR